MFIQNNYKLYIIEHQINFKIIILLGHFIYYGKPSAIADDIVTTIFKKLNQLLNMFSSVGVE